MENIVERLRSGEVPNLEQLADLIEQLQREIERMKWDVHSCGPTCTKAGCVNRQLREELAAKDQRIAELEEENQLWLNMATTRGDVVDRLEMELTVKDQRIAELTRREKSKRDERNEISQMLAAAQQRIAELEELLREAYADADDVLRPQLAASQHHNQQLREQLFAKDQRIAELEKELAEDRSSHLKKHSELVFKTDDLNMALRVSSGLRQQLAASQAHNKQLREALETLLDKYDIEWRGRDFIHKALSLPTDTTALGRVISEYKQDAERYRWLRERDLNTIANGGVFAGKVPENVVINGDDLDAAIDSTIRARAGK